MTPKARVLLVDDSADIVLLYQRLIDAQDDLCCVGSLDSTVGLEEAIRDTRADVAVIDLVGPGRDSLEAIRAASAECPACRLVAFSGHDDQATLDSVLDAGGWGLVSKHGEPMALIERIRRIHAESIA